MEWPEREIVGLNCIYGAIFSNKRDTLQALEPFPEERIDETIVSVKPVENLRFLEFAERHFDGGGIVGRGSGEELLGTDRLAAKRRNAFEDSCLVCGKMAHECREMFLLSRKDGVEGVFNRGVVDCATGGRFVPDCAAKFLNVSRRGVCDVGDYVELSAAKASFAGGKAGTDEREEVVRVDYANGERGGASVERAVWMHEDIGHPVPYASEEDVGRPCVKLDPSAHDGDDPLAVLDVEDVLKFIKDYADFAFRRLGEKCVKNCIERSRLGGKSSIDGKRRRTGGRVDGERGLEVGERLDGFCEPSFGCFQSCKCSEKSFAKVGLVANAKEVCVKKGNAFHPSHGFKHKGRLAHSSFSLNKDILPGFDVLPKAFCQLRPLTEVFSVNGASVLERVHASILYCVWYYTVLYYTILYNARIVSNPCVSLRSVFAKDRKSSHL